MRERTRLCRLSGVFSNERRCLCKLRDVEIVQDAGGVFNMGRKDNGCVGGKKGYIYSRSCDFFVKLVLFVNEHKTAQPSSCSTTRHLMNEKPRDQI